MKKVHYYLFGSKAVDVYLNRENESMSFLASKIMDTEEFDVFRYSEDFDSPTELLLAYGGWNSFVEIDGALYTEILELKDVEGVADKLVSQLIDGETVAVHDRYLAAVTRKLREIKKNCITTLSQIKNR